jgi:hypothetical protein
VRARKRTIWGGGGAAAPAEPKARRPASRCEAVWAGRQRAPRGSRKPGPEWPGHFPGPVIPGPAVVSGTAAGASRLAETGPGMARPFRARPFSRPGHSGPGRRERDGSGRLAARGHRSAWAPPPAGRPAGLRSRPELERRRESRDSRLSRNM